VKLQLLQAPGVALGLFVGVYAAAFVAVAVIRPAIQAVIPLIIWASLISALALIFAFTRRGVGPSEFGFRIPRVR
jgi:hypothetical protein